MKFDKTLNEATQETINKLNKITDYLEHDFKKLYRKESKLVDHIRQENFLYKGKNYTKFAVMVILKQKSYDEEKDQLVKIIKDLALIKDLKAEVVRNGIIIKILIKEALSG
jgi:hypothetical protein